MAPLQRSPKRTSPKALVVAVLGGVGTLVAPRVLEFVAPGSGIQHVSKVVPRTRGAALQLAALGGADDIMAMEDAKARLMDLLNDENIAAEVLRPEGKPMRGQVDEAILQMERMNPTDEPVYSELLDGDWKVKYAGSYAPGLLSSPTREIALFLYGGLSLGNALSSFTEGFWGQSLGIKAGEKLVTIKSGRDVEATAELEVNSQMQTLKYMAELVPLSARRMSEEVTSLDLPEPIGQREPPLELRRSILVTYLDESLMIARDESGAAEVLVREPVMSPFGMNTEQAEPVSASPTTPVNATTKAEADDGAQDPLSASAA